MSASLHSYYVDRGTALGMTMPHIAKYHSGPFRIAVILADPGGKFTAGSGAEKTSEIGLRNPDPTAGFLLRTIQDVGIELSEYLPLNALAGYNLRNLKKNREVSAGLNSDMIQKAGVKAVILGGVIAQSAKRYLNLPHNFPVFQMPHPSARGRGMATRQSIDAAKLIRTAFENARSQP
ncbi:MAG: hypothetical protein WBC93_07145 [Sulfitobacter sp.]